MEIANLPLRSMCRKISSVVKSTECLEVLMTINGLEFRSSCNGIYPINAVLVLFIVVSFLKHYDS